MTKLDFKVNHKLLTLVFTKMKLISLLLTSLLLLTGCTPVVTTKLEQSIPMAGTYESVKVLRANTDIPVDAEILGTVKIGDSGFTATKNCTFLDVINSAKEEAKKSRRQCNQDYRTHSSG